MDQLGTLDLPGGPITLRRAEVGDLPALVALLTADQLGAGRETPDEPGPYRAAFDEIAADPAQLLVVAVEGGAVEGGAVEGGAVIGTLQLSVIPGLARHGARRGQIEAVRVRAGTRNRGVGAAMIRWTIEEARRRGCALVQLTTDKRRTDAHRFYERLGFVASHEGMKLSL